MIHDDPLSDYNPTPVPTAAGGYGSPINAVPSAFPPAAPAQPDATPRVAPVPAADPDAFTTALTDLGATLRGQRLTARVTIAGANFGMPGTDLELEHLFEATTADGKLLDELTQRALQEAAVEALYAQGYLMGKENTLKLREQLANEPKGVASLHSVRYTPEHPPAGTAAGTTAPAGSGAAAVAAVANGAATVERWDSNPGFGADPFRWVKPQFLPTPDVEDDGRAWLIEQGLDLKYFVIYDDRPGTPNGRGAGEKMGSAANIKWSEEGKAVLDANNLGHFKNLAVARSRFNNDESLYWYFGKNQDANKSIDAMMSFAGKTLFKGDA